MTISPFNLIPILFLEGKREFQIQVKKYLRISHKIKVIVALGSNGNTNPAQCLFKHQAYGVLRILSFRILLFFNCQLID